MPRICLAWLFALAFAATGASAWEDNFNQATLDARWTWRTPVRGPTFSLQERPGWLRIHIPQRDVGFNHWNEPRADEAPQLRAQAPEGDWELEARVQLQTFAPENHFHVGVMVGLNDAQILTWGLLQGPGIPGGPKEPEVWLEPTGTSGYFRLPGPADDVTLRLTKSENTFTPSVRRGTGPWVLGNPFTFPAPPRFLGLIGKTFSNGPGIAFDVDYVRLTLRPGAVRPAPAAPGESATAPKQPDPGRALPPEASLPPHRNEPLESPGPPLPDAVAVPDATVLAQRLCDVGDRCLLEKRYGDAQACYQAALALLPDTPAAKAGLAKLRLVQRSKKTK